MSDLYAWKIRDDRGLYWNGRTWVQEGMVWAGERRAEYHLRDARKSRECEVVRFLLVEAP